MNYLNDWELEIGRDPYLTAVLNLRYPTLAVLKAIDPDFEIDNTRDLDKVHILDIDKFDNVESDKWSYYARIPYWVIDNWAQQMTGNQWKVFIYIVRRCTFDPKHNNFGRCWLKYDDIKTRTRVQGVQCCVKALVNINAIKVHHKRRDYGRGIVTSNQFTVPYFRQMKRLGIWT